MNPLARQTAHWQRAQKAIGLFYGINLALTLWALDRSADWSQLPSPIWPVQFFSPSGLVWGLILVALSLPAALRPQSRWARLLAVGGMVLHGALESSFGKVLHHHHAWIWFGVLWVALPARSDTRLHRQATLNTVFAATAVLLGFYFLGGLWKMAAALNQVFLGAPSLFSEGAMARHLAFHSFTEGRSPWLLPWAVAQPNLGDWSLRLHVFVSLMAPLALRFRSWLPLLGVYFALFHLVAGLTMDIWFLRQGLLCMGLTWSAGSWNAFQLPHFKEAPLVRPA